MDKTDKRKARGRHPGRSLKAARPSGSRLIAPSPLIRGLLVLPALLILSGCDHRDPVDTPVNWWHQLEGGEIAKQRPPPPGVDDPYPKVGTTPASPPVLLSPQLRAALTENLIEQRNLSTRLNAIQPLPPPVLGALGKTSAKPPATSAAPAGAAAPGTTPVTGTAPAAPQTSSATLDAAEAPPPPPPGPAQHPKAAATEDTGPELAMPAIVPDQAGQAIASGPIPPIAAAPPAPPSLPGIVLPPPPSYVPPAHPNYLLTAEKGELLQFQPGSDALSPGQNGILSGLATRRGSGVIYVRGHGEAGSDAPADQAQALTLAALRARTVADALTHDGVPQSAIRLRADAFGRGASAGLVE